MYCIKWGAEWQPKQRSSDCWLSVLSPASARWFAGQLGNSQKVRRWHGDSQCPLQQPIFSTGSISASSTGRQFREWPWCYHLTVICFFHLCFFLCHPIRSGFLFLPCGELFQVWEMWLSPQSEKPVGSEVGGQDPHSWIGSPVGNQACIVPWLLWDLLLLKLPHPEAANVYWVSLSSQNLS